MMNASNINRASQLAKVFQQSIYSKLVETLPMDDAMFVAKLFSNDLLPGDLKNQLKLVHRTSADEAVLFLDSVIIIIIIIIINFVKRHG